MSSPTRARGNSQLGAILRKNLLLKRRAPKTTCAEVLSPPLFLSILVLGYFLSETKVYGVGIYASTEVNVASLISTLGPLVSGSAQVAVPGAGVAGTQSECEVTSLNTNLTQCGIENTENVDLFGLRGSLTSIINGPLPVLNIDTFLSIGRAQRARLEEPKAPQRS